MKDTPATLIERPSESTETLLLGRSACVIGCVCVSDIISCSSGSCQRKLTLVKSVLYQDDGFVKGLMFLGFQLIEMK